MARCCICVSYGRLQQILHILAWCPTPAAEEVSRPGGIDVIAEVGCIWPHRTCAKLTFGKTWTPTWATLMMAMWSRLANCHGWLPTIDGIETAFATATYTRWNFTDALNWCFYEQRTQNWLNASAPGGAQRSDRNTLSHRKRGAYGFWSTNPASRLRKDSTEHPVFFIGRSSNWFPGETEKGFWRHDEAWSMTLVFRLSFSFILFIIIKYYLLIK